MATAPATLIQLTNSGYDSQPQWSPDGRWIAFLSERGEAKGGKSCEEATLQTIGIAQLYVISLNGGEAIAVTQGDEKVHAFAWSPDSGTLYFATRTPWTQEPEGSYEKEWKDVCQYRLAERGDQIFSVKVGDAIARQAAAGNEPADPARASDATPWARALGSTPWRIHQMSSGSRWPPACICNRGRFPSGRRRWKNQRSILSILQSRPRIRRRARLLTMKRSNRPFAGTTTAATFSFRSTMVPWKGSTRIRRPGSIGWMPIAGQCPTMGGGFLRASGSLRSCVRWRRPGRSQAGNRSSGLFPSQARVPPFSPSVGIGRHVRIGGCGRALFADRLRALGFRRACRSLFGLTAPASCNRLGLLPHSTSCLRNAICHRANLIAGKRRMARPSKEC